MNKSTKRNTTQKVKAVQPVKQAVSPNPQQPIQPQPPNPPVQPVFTAVTQFHSGSLPHPSTLQGYNSIVPGAAERIIVMAEEDARHQREMEKAALKAASDESWRGQICGAVLGLAALASSLLALYLGSQAVAGIIGGTTVVGLVTVYVTGKVASKHKADD